MVSNLSVAQILAELERQVASHEEQEKLHAEQEAFHQEKRAHHAGELKAARERTEAFRAAAVAAGELVERGGPATLSPPAPALPKHRRRPVSWVVAQVLDRQRPDSTFTATDIAQAANGLFGDQLRRRLDSRAASVTLRRLAAAGRLRILREGAPHREALYSRTRPAGTG